MISNESSLWRYFSEEENQLARDGELLLEDRDSHPNQHLSDYSYLVFPFAKLYEGFLKQLFLDVHVISERDYRSDHFRIGRVLSPNLIRRLGRSPNGTPRSAYAQLDTRYGEGLAADLWNAWKKARNLVFHYYPHNYRALSLDQAKELVRLIIRTMEGAIEKTSGSRAKS
ncbi:MAG: hypothetical protein Q7S76_03855 [bacterium]|nr:hypothetical protein [bacterium]